MFDIDPRDIGARLLDEPLEVEGSRGPSGDARHREGQDDWSHPGSRQRDRDGDIGKTLGRGPDGNGGEAGASSGDRRDEARWQERDSDPRERGTDPRDVFTRQVNLPRGHEREVVLDRDREYTLRGSEVRALATVGEYRVVSSRDIAGQDGQESNPASGDLRHLREQGLIETVRVPGYRDHVVTLTKAGKHLLDANRDRDAERPQRFYAGLKRERELEHDVQVYRASDRAAEALGERGAHVERVVLDYELKSEYQRWLHERDRDHDDYDGRPDRSADEVREWAREHDLPYFDGQVHFPDVRIEYRDADDRWAHEDIEVLTPHYRGAHGASAVRSGFSCYRGSSLRVGGRGGGKRGGGGRLGGLAEEMWL